MMIFLLILYGYSTKEINQVYIMQVIMEISFHKFQINYLSATQKKEIGF